MKRGIFTSVSVLLLFSACRKEEMAASLTNPQKSNKVFVSDWEGVNANLWQQSVQVDGTTTFTYSKDLPQLNGGVMSDGLMAVYTKGYASSEINVDRPMSLPFLLYTNDHQAVPFAWEIVKANKRVDVMIRIPADQEGEFNQGQTGVKFRYIVVPREYLLQNNLTASKVSRMSYQELSELLEFPL